MTKTPTEYRNLAYQICQLAKQAEPDPDDPRRAHMDAAQAHLMYAAEIVERVAEYLPLKEKRAGR